MLERMWRKRSAFTLLEGVYINSSIVEDSVAIPQDLEIEIAFDPAIPLLSIYPKDYKSFYCKDTCSTVYNSKDLEPTQIPINDRWDKENVAHIHHGILYKHKKRMSSCPLQGHG